MESRDGDAHKDCPKPEGEERIVWDCPLRREESRSPHSQRGVGCGMISHREPEAPGLGELPIGTSLGISTARPFLLFVISPPVKMSQGGSSELENLLGQWESSQLADKSPQWEQPVLFPMLLVIPGARKYPQIPLPPPSFPINLPLHPSNPPPKRPP